MSGNYYSPTPLDFRLLELMPEKGILGGVHWAGRRVKDLVSQINDTLGDGMRPLQSSEVQARTRAMKVAGYVEDFPGKGGRIWARTPEGSAFLATKSTVLGA